jgi:uncharacterized protein YuzE
VKKGKKIYKNVKYKKNIKILFDEDNDILYLSLKEGADIDSEEVAENVRVEYDSRRNIVGIEIFNITKILATALSKKIKEEMIKVNA